MFKIKDISSFLAGLIFLWSSLGKIGNVVYFQYLIVEYGLSYLNILAPFLILAEILIGVLLLFNRCTKVVSISAIGLLIVFTIAFTYAWQVNGITDCGCFGAYALIKSSPLLTYLRNAILLVLLGVSIALGKNDTDFVSWKRISIFTIMFAATFVAGMTYRPLEFIERINPYENQIVSDTPLKKFYTQEQDSSSLVMFFSYSCSHCINSIENFKAWKSTGKVSNTLAFVVIDSVSTQVDSLRLLFHQRYPALEITEIEKDSVDFVEGYPTSFLIQDDTIKRVIVGELPSPYLFEH